MIEVCIGSACHIKGSYKVITELKRLIEENRLVTSVELKSSFCLGHCGHGVSVRVNETDIYSLRPEEVESFFNEHIKVKL